MIKCSTFITLIAVRNKIIVQSSVHHDIVNNDVNHYRNDVLGRVQLVSIISECIKCRPNVLIHSSQNPTRKLAARTFIQSQYLKELAARLRLPFCDEW